MPEPLRIPKLGNTVEDVTIIEWMVADGALVKKGQEVLEIETENRLLLWKPPLMAIFTSDHTIRAM